MAPAGRAATPPPPRFKGQPGGGIFERLSLRSLRLQAQRRQRRGFFGGGKNRSCASAVGCRDGELHSLWCLSASSHRIPSKPSRPLARSKGARTLGVGVVSLRRQPWTPFRVLPPSPGGVRVAHRGRRRVCGAAARLGGYEVRTPGDRRQHPALRENAGREVPKPADASQIPRLCARWR